MQKKKITLHIIIFLILICLFTILYGIVLPFFSSFLPLRALQICSIYIILIALTFFMNHFVEKQPLSTLGFSKKSIGKQILIGIFISLGLSVLFIGGSLIIGITPENFLPFRDKAILFQFFYKLFFVGFGEELVFRGYLQNRLSFLLKGKYTNIIIASLLFGMWHFILNGNISQVLVASIIGLILGFCKVKIPHCTIISLSIGHGLYNFILALLSFVLL